MSDGIKHWKYSRISSLVIAPLTIWFVIFFSINFGMTFEHVSSSLAKTINSVMMCLFITTTIFHLQQGLQVIIEDYVYNRAWINLNIILCSALFVVSILSIGKIAILGV